MLRFASIPLLVAALGGPVMAQNYFGKWFTPSGGQPTTEYYVSNTTGSNSNAGTLSEPFRDITHALTQVANLQSASPATPVTINVLPGTYSAASGERLPLRLPAFGVALETYNPAGGSQPTARAQIVQERSSEDAILIDRVTFHSSANPGSLPETVIHGLTVTGGHSSIHVAPHFTGQPAPQGRAIGVEIRRCVIDGVLAGIFLQPAPEWTSLVVIEDNDIVNDSPTCGNCSGIIEVLANATLSSTLIRSNRISSHWQNIVIVNGGSHEDVRPRIQSNFVQLGQENVSLVNCSATVINNTIAFAIEHVAGASSVSGLSVIGGHVEVLNNVLWNPVPGSGAPVAQDMYLAPGTTAVVDSNDSTVGLPGNNYAIAPNFVAGDAHPGTYAVNPYAPVDLHLAYGINPNSLQELGSRLHVADLTMPSLEITFSLGGYVVRRDVALDVDRDPRTLSTSANFALQPDIGADEVNELTLSLSAAGPLDEQGHMSGMLSGNVVTVNLQGIPAANFAIYLGLGFTGDPVMHQSWTPLGVTNLDFSNPLTAQPVVLGSTLDPTNGQATASFQLPPMSIDYAEAEIYLQAVQWDLNGRGAFSRRMRLELNP